MKSRLLSAAAGLLLGLGLSRLARPHPDPAPPPPPPPSSAVVSAPILSPTPPIPSRPPTSPKHRPPSTSSSTLPTVTAAEDGTLTLSDPASGTQFTLSAEDARNLSTNLLSASSSIASSRPRGPSWSPGQAAGPPDTTTHADSTSAWAPASQNGGREWLKVSFPKSVEISEINIHESYNPGAVSRVVALLPNGRERTLWEGAAAADSALIEHSIPVHKGTRSDTIRIELDTSRVPGWNEIDAVELVGSDGSRQWASSATASSWYGEPFNTPIDGFVPAIEFLNSP
jgi:hypothetical protein